MTMATQETAKTENNDGKGEKKVTAWLLFDCCPFLNGEVIN